MPASAAIRKQRYQAKKLAGLCVESACQNVVQVGVRCDACKDKAVSIYHAKKRAGLCSRNGCHRLTNDGNKSCKECLTVGQRSATKLKDEVFTAYGGYICNCCGETIKPFLSIDHIDGNGSQHRKIIGRGGLYRWLKKNNFPPGFQVLCMNCNFGKAKNNGICPHKE